MPFASINSTNPRNSYEKVLRIGRAGKKQAAHSYEASFISGFWFLQNLGKDFIRNNMHTTVGGVLSQQSQLQFFI